MRVIVFGTFDDLHPGHRFFLDKAAKRAYPGELIIVIARDQNVVRMKGRPPVYTEKERMAALRGAHPDATILPGHETDFLHWIHELHPELLMMGYDQKLPPGLREEDIRIPIERLPAFEPDKWKSSLRRNE